MHDVHDCFARIKFEKYGDCPDHGKLQKCLLRELQNSSTVAAADRGGGGPNTIPWRAIPSIILEQIFSKDLQGVQCTLYRVYRVYSKVSQI